MKKIQSADWRSQIKDKNVLVRIDADVPIIDGKVLDDERLRASLPTIKYLLENDAKVTIIGHIGRPKGKEVFELKIRPVEDKLIELIGTHTNWQILENLRFDAGEEENNSEFAKQLATGQDIFIQDAFATCHRAHASTVGVTKILPSYAGFSVQGEVENLEKILASSKEGLTIIIGGKKAEDKLPVIENLFQKCENFLVGGVVANTFLAAQGINLGKSIVERQVLDQAKKILQKFQKKHHQKLLLPVDLVFSKAIDAPENIKKENVGSLEHIDEYFATDIGPKTIEQYKKIINLSKTIFFNGNMGISEMREFSDGTKAMAEAIANSTSKKYAGGGDTTSFIRKMGLADKFDFISTGGGATLEFLAGKNLPGLL